MPRNSLSAFMYIHELFFSIALRNSYCNSLHFTGEKTNSEESCKTPKDSCVMSDRGQKTTQEVGLTVREKGAYAPTMGQPVLPSSLDRQGKRTIF